jgi:2'-hydroxyisoflavone reductase
MRILILGGTLFVGRHLAQAALARGHAVTLFNRGSRPAPFPGVETLRGDRRRDLSALAGGRWDAAIDTSGYTPGAVRAAAGLLAGGVGHYTFLSSVSVYTRAARGESSEDGPADAVDESAPVKQVPAGRLAELEAIEPAGPIPGVAYGAEYGGLKALCETAAEEAMGGRALIVRPGLVVGPHDPTDRFTYWPGRVARGGEVLAPGEPGRPRQLIDVRDLAGWILRRIETGGTGTYNAAGPQRSLAMASLLEECRTAAGSDARFTWVSDDFLLAAGVAPWTEMPLWLPRGNEPPALVRADCRKALAAGLSFRPLAETILDTLAWDRARPPGERRAGLAPEKEVELLRRWHGERSGPGGSRGKGRDRGSTGPGRRE